MKKLIVWVLALAMMLGCTAAFAEDATGIEFEMTIYVDPDALYRDSEMAEFYDSMGFDGQAIIDAQNEVTRCTAELVNLITGHMLYLDEQVSLSLNLKGKPILTADVGFNADGEFLMNTSMLPSYTLVYTAEDMAASDEEDARLMEALQEMVLPLMQIYTSFVEESDAHITAVEEGTFEINSQIFDRKITIQMTGEECWAIIRNAQAQLIPLVEKLLVAYGMEEDAEAMEASIEDIKEQETPDYLAGGTVTLLIYTSQENPMAIYREFAFESQAYSMYGELTVDGYLVKMHLMTGSGTDTYADKAAMEKAAAEGKDDVVEMIDAVLEIDEENRQILLTVENTGYTYARHEVSLKDGETEMEMSYKGYQQKDGKPMMEITLKGWETDRKPEPVTADGKTVIYYSDLERANENIALGEEHVTEEDYALITGIDKDISKAGNSLGIQIILAAPEEVQALIDAETEFSNMFMYTIPNFNETLTPIELPEEDASF